MQSIHKKTCDPRRWCVGALLLIVCSTMQSASALVAKPSAAEAIDAPVQEVKSKFPIESKLGADGKPRVGHFMVRRPGGDDLVLKINGSAIIWMLVALAVIAVALIVFFVAPDSKLSDDACSAIQPQKSPVDAFAYVRHSPPHVYGVCEPGRTDVLLPSGIWRGYSQEDDKDFEVVEFVLDFTSAGENHPGQVQGSGTDDTGKYSLAGICEQRRLAFQKKYIWGTPALDGRVNHDANSGHVVEYRAEWAGESLRKGIKGMWYIEELAGTTRSRGRFHIWPAMDGWQRIGQKAMAPITPATPDATGLKSGDSPRRITAFKVDKEQICAKCFENPINVCLLPCGHTAICRDCESRLRHRLCPICYAPVNMIVTENGTVLKSRQNGQKPALQK